MKILSLVLGVLISFQCLHAANVGLLIVATGKYIDFVNPLIQSAEIHFCKNHHVTYFVFTDRGFEIPPNTIITYQKRLGWPYDTMMRGHIYYQNRDLFEDQDYLFACDADMLFVGEVGDEILGEQVATLHPGFVGRTGSFETNRRSTAFVNPRKAKTYFCGGFYGGARDRFLDIAKTNAANIDDDLNRGLIAVWHDESHWNRYCVDHPPTVILNPSYCYPESVNLDYPKKLIALDKNHSEYRKQ
jgi:histo-blood group ABO system transferase